MTRFGSSLYHVESNQLRNGPCFQTQRHGQVAWKGIVSYKVLQHLRVFVEQRYRRAKTSRWRPSKVKQPPSVPISPLQHVCVPQLLRFVLLMKCWMETFFSPPAPLYIFSRVANSWFLSFFSFLLLHFFSRWSMIICLHAAADVVLNGAAGMFCLAQWMDISCVFSPHPCPPNHDDVAQM